MTNENGNAPLVQKVPVQSQLLQPPEVAMMAEFVRGLAEPLAKSQETQAKETTRQVEAMATIQGRMYLYSFIIVVLLIALATTAMLLDKDLITQAAFSIATLLLGVWVGRSTKK